MTLGTCAILNSFGFLDLRLSAFICGERFLIFLDLPLSFVFLGVLCGSRPFPISISVISENQWSDFFCCTGLNRQRNATRF